jgi:hypothetical protein
MERSAEWSPVAEFGAGYEADVAEAVLGAHEIPVLREGGEPGIFGAAFAGATANGVTLFVPRGLLDDARAALSLPPRPASSETT